jgi:predicted Ser/Thr protein kinase/tetratricopeptide (TPR) repeat protein
VATSSGDDDRSPAFAATEAAPAAGSVGVAMAAARPGDPLAARLAEASVAASLFGTNTLGLGRFRVLERLGAGGMGVVYAAYDPDLDRGVAIKLVRIDGDREVALAEGKALARLSHPNVVPVFDVGREGDHIYIVMELVRGTTLRAWSKARSRAEVLAAYLEAGQGLAAAHAAGLVHRDFKPDNVLVGSDRRIRVVDFGLACAAASDHTGDEPQPWAGTPRYMAPEQAAGAAVTPAADQYSFCQALAEALGEDDRSTPLPRWLGGVLERGRAAEPQARFASMAQLLRALARDPARIWRRRIVLGAVALVTPFAFLAGQQLTARADACGGGEAEIAATWPPAARTAALARIASVSPYGRELAPWLDGALHDITERWLIERRDACVAHRRGVQSDVVLDRRMACLARTRTGLGAVAERIAQADAGALPTLPLAVRAILEPARCADATALLADIEPPPQAQAQPIAAVRRDLDRAQVEVAAGRYTVGREAAARSVTAARAIGYRPLLAEALVLEGRALCALEDRVAALPRLEEATTLALAAGANALAIEAWGRRAWAQSTEDKPLPGRSRDRALDGLDLIEPLAASPHTSPFARAVLYSHLGGAALSRSQRNEARQWYQRAVAESRGVSGDAAVQLIGARRNLAIVEDDPARSDAILSDAADEQSRLLGADHPGTLVTRYMRGTVAMRELAPAAAYLTKTCIGYELHPTLAAQTSECWAEVGYLLGELGDRARALATLQRALPGADRENIATSSIAPYIALWRGAPADAVEQFTAALAAVPNEPVWKRHERAQLQLGLGRALRAAGRPAMALPALAASTATLAEMSRNHPSAVVLRRLGRARVELALSLAESGDRSAEVAITARAALAWLRQAGGRSDEIAALERLAAPAPDQGSGHEPP